MEEKIGVTHNYVLINRNFSDLNPIVLGWEHCKPDKFYGPAVRNYTLIHYIVSGKGSVSKADASYEVRAGEAFLIFPDEVVTYVADHDDPWSYQWIGFDGRLSEKLRTLPTVIRFPHELIQEMLNIPKSDMQEYHIAALLFQMYASLFESQKHRHHYVRHVQDHIRALYMQPLRVEQIAEEMNLDRRYLSRLFKEKTGQTVQDYLISVRMEEAKRRLEQGFSVEETAQLCGYEDPCNFSKMFKRRFGVSPLYWRRDLHK